MMKKFVFALFALLISVGFIACQNESTENATTATPEATVATPAANPTQPKKPDFQAKAESAPRTTIQFASEEYDYGKVPAGTKVTYQFKFTNTGSEPLEITRVKPSCGCTTPRWSKETVAPGEDGFIDVEFNTAGKAGVQNKSVTVTGNFEGNINKVLRLKGEVLKGDA